MRRRSSSRKRAAAFYGATGEVVDYDPNFTYSEHQQLVRKAERLSGYYEMPMAIVS